MEHVSSNCHSILFKTIAKDKKVLVIGGCNLSFNHGYIKTDNIKFLNNDGNVYIEHDDGEFVTNFGEKYSTQKDFSVDYLVDLKSLSESEINKLIPEKFEVIFFEYLPFDEYELFDKIKFLATKDHLLITVGFNLHEANKMRTFDLNDVKSYKSVMKLNEIITIYDMKNY